MKNILMIAYSFPPSALPGVYRTLYFARYFPQNGWIPIILTVPEDSYPVVDYSLLSKIPKHLDIFRVPYIGKSIDILMQKNVRGNQGLAHQKLSWMRKISLKLKEQITFFPDKMVMWVLPAYHYAKQIIQKGDIHLIYTTSPFNSVHLIGYLLKRTTTIPWIADFRDPWLHAFTEWTDMQRRIQNILEYQVMMHADRIITVSMELMDDALERFPSLNPKKFSVITNGFDPEDFDDVVYQPEEKFIITHTGGFYGKRSPITFMLALKQLFSENPEIGKNTKVRFVGSFDKTIESEIKQMGLGENMGIIGQVSHKEAIQYQCNSDLLLLIPGPKTLTLPGKFFEYLASRKPILALTEYNTESAMLVRKTRSGIVVNPNDISQIKNALYSMYVEYESDGLLEVDLKAIERYSRPFLTQMLATVCEEVLENR